MSCLKLENESFETNPSINPEILHNENDKKIFRFFLQIFVCQNKENGDEDVFLRNRCAAAR